MAVLMAKHAPRPEPLKTSDWKIAAAFITEATRWYCRPQVPRGLHNVCPTVAHVCALNGSWSPSITNCSPWSPGPRLPHDAMPAGMAAMTTIINIMATHRVDKP